MSDTAPRGSRRGLVAGGVSGLLAGLAAVAVSEAFASLLTGVTSPVLAVGNRAVDATPRPVKEWAIEHFGSRDKPVLILGVLLTLALLALVLGAVGVRRPRAAVAGFLVLSAVAAVAAVGDRAATAAPVARLVPVAALTVTGVTALLLLLRTLRAPATAPSPGGTRDASTPTGAEGSAATSGRPTDDLPADERPADDPPGDDLPTGFDRRVFLQTATAVGAVAVAGALGRQAFSGSAAAAQRAGLTLPRPTDPAPPVPSGSSLDVAGLSPYLTPTRDFYRVDTALRIPDVPIDGYTLRVHGMVDTPLELSFADLLDRRLVERRITLTCVSNPVGGEYVGNATWLGVPVRDLLAEAGVRPGADAVRSRSADDMTIGTPLQPLTDPTRDALIAVGMNGRPLPLAHGFPVRMVVPGLYGYVSATKWLVDLEVTRFADFKAYWSTRGYSVKAPIKTSSRIDVPRSFARLRSGAVTVAGVAWAQGRGIGVVEVRVDGGTWQQAQLADADGVDSWRQWRWRWDARPGNHTIEVRATDGTGHSQTADRAPIAPNGSTGWHRVDVTVT
jgi:DMSO/TMAO reductase YedYZ molybdopterin-dependent catalytic subunit